MNRAVLILLAGLGLVLGAGCTSTSYQGTKDVQAGPTYTEEEKEDMTEEEKVAAYNEQVRDKDKLICRQEMRTGSHRKVTICRTVAEKEEEETNARDMLLKSRGLSGNPYGN